MKSQDRWRAAARTVVENPKRAGWAIEDAFGLSRVTAFRAYFDLFSNDDGIALPQGTEEVAISYCLMAAVMEIEGGGSGRSGGRKNSRIKTW